MKPRTKAPKNEQLTGTLTGDLAAYASEGLLQHPLSERTHVSLQGCIVGLSKSFARRLSHPADQRAIFIADAARQVQ